ncbi:sulfatase-like hydrolase/transferase [Halomicroarcula sp. F13]|uniref:Sulfatase-like hydrolase/transferase n=1 Tax=Haloarcula rubra TaxID=2487747 RepID=A0AAW4PX86_9EURY|nr:sulfatase-like hydrolase/transferase [Halomicroarcula rubra]MBX0325915.1 sulfatase-like hydrolase/transferase [Halomicroarcula rubra]
MNTVVLLTVDSLRADRLTDKYFPECMQRFESDFTHFSNAYSHGVATPFAFPGILAGVPVQGDGTLPQNTETIADHCKGTAVALKNNMHLSAARGYDSGFDSFQQMPESGDIVDRLKDLGRQSNVLKSAYQTVTSLLDDDTVKPVTPPYATGNIITDGIKTFLDTYDPNLLWGHYMDTHFPFSPATLPHEIDIDATPQEINRANDAFAGRTASETQLDLIERLYDKSAQYLDRQLESVFSYLEVQELYDESLIIVVSDHGEAFGDDGLQSHPWSCDPADALIHTPLLVKYPEQEAGKKIDRVVGHNLVYEIIKAHFSGESDACQPGESYDAPVISKSNNVIRATTPSGIIFRRRDGSVNKQGSVSEAARQAARDAVFPEIPTSTGEIPGVSEDDRQEIEEQLEALGYK